jgi:RNA polymerase sigma-70 factor (ECF subfamily)
MAPAAVRQLASRARRHVRGQSPWPSTDAAEHRRVVEAFAVYHQGELVTVASVTVAAGRVTRLDLVRAPGKLPRPVR